MAIDDSQDDDRTVIRPPAPLAPPPPPPLLPEQTLLVPQSPQPAMERTMAVGAPPPSAPDIGNGLAVGTYLAEFELTSMLGEGGFGIVYLAQDHSLQRRVALKEYMPSSLAARTSQTNVQVKSERYRETFEAGLKSFINEARLLASFDHPSLVKVYRFWEANGTAYMVMPFYEGKTLKDQLREMGSRPDEAWLRTLLAPLTEALRVIHAEQCYHRDIAPDNVMMLAGSNRPLLLDFGAARRVIGDMTQALTVILKPGYAPVEQYAEIPGMKQGPWTDVYALAAVVYFAIIGKTPPPSVGRLLNDTYVPLVKSAEGRYSESFLAAIDRALVVKPEERTQSIPQLRAELGLDSTSLSDQYTTRPYAAPGDIAPRPAPSAVPAPKPPSVPTNVAPAVAKKGNVPLIGIGAGVLVLGIAGFAAYSFLAPPPRPAPAPNPAVAVAPTPAPTPAAAPPTAPPVAVPPAPVAAVVPPAAGLDPMREFERVVQASDASYNLRAQSDKASLRIGRDEINFSVQADREGSLYVFAASSDGTLVQVVPNKFSGSVLLKKGERYKFPTGDPAHLDAADPPGAGALLVMVSARQRDHSALEPRSEGSWRFFPSGADGARVVASHKGPQPLMAGRAICPANGACDESFGAAVLKVDFVK
jgi:serine/threonine protein kinase